MFGATYNKPPRAGGPLVQPLCLENGDLRTLVGKKLCASMTTTCSVTAVAGIHRRRDASYRANASEIVEKKVNFFMFENV